MHRPVCASLVLFVAAVVLCACQKSDQSAIQPEKIADSTSATRSDAPSSAAPTERSAGGPGPLIPYASGRGPSDVKPTPSRKSSSADASAPPTASGSSPEGSSTAVPIPVAEVKLLEAGREPRRELRLKAAVGQVDKIKMTMTMAVEMQMGAQSQPKSALPPMIFGMTMKVAEVRPNGDIRYDFTVGGTDVGAAPGVDPRVVKALKDALKQLDGLSGQAVLSDRGLSREAKMNIGGKASAQTQQVMQGMEAAMQQIGAPLPEEPVGVGARWEHVATIVQQGVRVRQKTTYDLAKIDGDKLTLGVKLEQDAPKQTVAAGGETLELLSLSASGAGKIDMRLSRLAPPKSSMDITSKVHMALPKNETMKVGTTMRIDIVGTKQ